MKGKTSRLRKATSAWA